jgi:hypothetical protein
VRRSKQQTFSLHGILKEQDWSKLKKKSFIAKEEPEIGLADEKVSK